MAKDPAFLFYSSDFLSGCIDLEMEERGQYITLLCAQHQKGHLSEKTIRLLVGSVSVNVLVKFSKDQEGNYFSERLDAEIEKRKKFTESRKLNGQKGGRKPSGLPYALPLGKPSENHTENENENGIDNKIKGVQIEKSLEWFVGCLDEMFVEQMKMTHRGKDLHQAAKEAFNHMAADKHRLRNADEADVKRLVNTWLSNQKPNKQLKPLHDLT